jgi:peptidoglycan/xylan/chitin deacetylase (PgdA/CDA1 family)
MFSLIADQNVVPAVMFHSVGLEESDWIFSFISEPVENFEDKIRCLKKAGFHFLFWEELYNYMAGKTSIDLPAILLSFDDGYLDNWVYVFPILKKYGAKGTIFVTPEFVDEKGGVRPNLEDVWNGRVSRSELIASGFLSWEEMKLMESAGIVDIQSHALTHTWYFSGPEVVAFHSPGEKRYPWVGWNARPETKPYYMQANTDMAVSLGTPIYDFKKSLVCRRFFPPDEVVKGVVEFVEQHGGRDFFLAKNWESLLRNVHDGLMAVHAGESMYETDEERQARVFHELAASKDIIEHKIGKQVDFICWPGGGYDQGVSEIARKCGYKAWTLSSADQRKKLNKQLSDPSIIKRIGSAPRQYFGQRFLGYTTGQEFVAGIRRHQGSLFSRIAGWWSKLCRIWRVAIR